MPFEKVFFDFEIVFPEKGDDGDFWIFYLEFFYGGDVRPFESKEKAVFGFFNEPTVMRKAGEFIAGGEGINAGG